MSKGQRLAVGKAVTAPPLCWIPQRTGETRSNDKLCQASARSQWHRPSSGLFCKVKWYSATFRGYNSFPSSIWSPLKMRNIDFPKTSVTNCTFTVPNKADERISQFNNDFTDAQRIESKPGPSWSGFIFHSGRRRQLSLGCVCVCVLMGHVLTLSVCPHNKHRRITMDSKFEWVRNCKNYLIWALRLRNTVD